MKILRPILNEDFLDDLDDRMISDALPQDNVVADEDAYPYEFMFTVSAIGKKVTPKQYTDNIKRLFKLLNKSFAISTKIAGFRELGPDTPIYVYWKRYQCNASRNVDGLDMHWMVSYAGKKYDDLDDLIKSVKEFTFYVNFQLDVNSAASIAQAVSKIITIFCSCVRSVYSSTVNPRNIWLSKTKDKQTRNDSYGLIEMKEPFAYQLEQGDLLANGDLWKLMHQMNP